ncbi:hypothetical protein [Microbacterium croceum]|nr:hypothetical protein [Microbacterium croceum]
MPAAATDVPAPPLVPGVHRVIRVIESEEGPFAGVLVTRGDAVAVRVDAAALAGWEGWRFGGSEHVAGPLDIVRRAQGHDVLLPWCTERASTFLGRRAAAGEALSPGECSTLVVSLLRALAELGRGDAVEETTGAWWLTDEGRPVFVLGEGDEARAGVVLLVAQLGESCTEKMQRRLLGVVEEGLRTNLEQQRRVPSLLLEKWEREVLEIAAPRVLRREGFAPVPAESPAIAALRGDRSSTPSRRDGRATLRRSTPQRSREDRAGRGGPFSGGAALAAGIAMRVRERAEVSRARFVRGHAEARAAKRRSSLRPRRRSLFVAGGAAIAVLLIGLLWPRGATSEVADGATDRAGAVQTSDAEGGNAPASAPRADPRGREADATPSPSAAESAPIGSEEDPVNAAARLLREISKCFDIGDEVCAQAVADGSSDVLASLGGEGARGGEATDSSQMELVDEYGDAAVIRLTPEQQGKADVRRGADSRAGRVLVLVRINEKWLVRGVYDVADQPE